MSITSITIKNFRSLESVPSLDVSDFNVFVGENDAGKSNILRALDLFFNHDRRDGYGLLWERDYCYQAKPRKRKADEIVITLEIAPPATFTDRSVVQWQKTWRREGLHRDALRLANGKDIPPRSKVAAFLKSMRYDYVPAIKGESYFQSLMGRLHDMLEATVKDDIRAASKAFAGTINSKTVNIRREIQTRLRMDTTIQLPQDLRELFAKLEFTTDSGGRLYSLHQLGDGIRVRHIPIVLRWLAEHANYRSAHGRPKAVTIWGYEEPENNLELRRCFDFAKEFFEHSDRLQTFITTHSPAFYTAGTDTPNANRVSIFNVTKLPSKTSSVKRVESADDLAGLNSAMGVLELVKPHYRRLENELADLTQATRDQLNTSRPTVFCEGPSDKSVVEAALGLFYPQHQGKVAVLCGGGHQWVRNRMIAWSCLQPTARAVGLFDKDTDAQTSRKQATGDLPLISWTLS